VNQATVNAINSWASHIQNSIVKVAPQVWSVAVQVKQMDSIGNLIISGIVLVLFGFGIYAAVRLFRWNFEKYHATDYDSDGIYIAGCIFSALGCIASMFFVLSALLTLFDQWVWIGAFHPSIAVAHDIISKALGK
jgi:ABC-type multidrug transport system permease subunit